MFEINIGIRRKEEIRKERKVKLFLNVLFIFNTCLKVGREPKYRTLV